jgi:hypothetical protein
MRKMFINIIIFVIFMMTIMQDIKCANIIKSDQ